MASSIRWPPELPNPSRADYGSSGEETRSRVPRAIGAPRQRLKYTVEPRLEELSWKLTQDQFHAFDYWWQYSIRAGAVPFDVQITDDGGTLVWYTVKWLGGYESHIDYERYEWEVRGRFRILGSAFFFRPSGTDELRGRASLGLNGRGTISITAAWAGKASMGLSAVARLNAGSLRGIASLQLTATGRRPPTPLRGVADLTLTATGMIALTSSLAREDSGYVLREDGSKFTREA